MKRLRGSLVCVVLVGLGGPAMACLNDEESSSHEREFRSQYGGLAEASSPDGVPGRSPVRHDVLYGGGAALLVGAFALSSRRTRSRA